MRAALPSSLNGYLLLGIGVITMPLLAAILHATFQIRRLTDFSQALVNESCAIRSARRRRSIGCWAAPRTWPISTSRMRP